MVVLSAELMTVVASYQPGVYSDMLPLLGLAGPRVTLASRCCVDLTWAEGLRRLLESNHAILADWWAVHTAENAMARLPRVLRILPHMRQLFVLDAIWSSNPLLLQCLAHPVFAFGSTFHGNFLDVAAHCANLNALKWLHDIGHPGCTTDAMDIAAGRGDLDMVRYLHRHRREGCTPKGLRQALVRGHVDVATYLLDHGLATSQAITDDPRMLQECARHGHLASMQFIYGHGGRELSSVVLDVAASHGHMEVVQWVHGVGNVACSVHAIDWAAASGHVDVVQWLHRHRHEGCTSQALVQAAMHGHLAVVHFLLDNQVHDFQGSMARAFDTAATHGHLDVVKYLNGLAGSKATVAAMDGAAGRGHLAIVQWLHQHRWEGCTRKAVDLAAKHNHLSVVQWLLHEYQPRSVGQWIRWRLFGPCTTDAMDGAASTGHLAMVQYLYVHTTAGCTRAAFAKAIEHNHLRVAQWISAHGLVDADCTKETMFAAAANGNVSAVQWLHHLTNRCIETATADSVAYMASRGGHVHVVEWLQELLPDHELSVTSLESAAATGYVGMVRWLLTHRRAAGCMECAARGAITGGYNNIVRLLELARRAGGNLCATCRDCSAQTRCGQVSVGLSDAEGRVKTRCLCQFNHNTSAS